MQTKASISENSMRQSQISNNPKMNPKEIKIKCCNRQALDMCINENCQQQQIFTCEVSTCKCQKQHVFCPKVNLRNIVDSIQQKVLPEQEIKNFIDLRIENIIENIIEDLSKLKQELIEQIPIKMKYSQLYQIQKRIFDHAYSTQNSQMQLKKKDSLILWRLATMKDQYIFFGDVKAFLNKFQNESLKSITTFSTQLNQLFEKNENEKKKIQFHLKNQANIKNLTSFSSIIKSDQFSIRLLKFFPSSIKNITLVYKASDNLFNLSKFKEICNKMTDTVILCQSNKGKIMGGYTPVYYDQDNKKTGQIRIADLSGESFMFSLTNNDKFIYKDKQSCALGWNRNQNYISFGIGQILIYDKANSNNKCQLQSGKSYHNQNYKKDDKDSFVKFNGNQSYACSLNEWQVWKVEI